MIILCMLIYKCTSGILNTNLCAILHLYTLCTYLGCGLCLSLHLSLLVNLSLCVLDIYMVYSPRLLHFYYHYIPLLLILYPLTHSTSCNWWLFKHSASMCLKNIFILGGILTACNWALLINVTPIIYYYMDTLWSVCLAWTYFSYPNFLVVQCWGHAVVLFPDLAAH